MLIDLVSFVPSKILSLTVLGDLDISLGLNDCIGIGDCTSLECPTNGLERSSSSFLGFSDNNDVMLVVLDLEDIPISWGCPLGTEEGLHVTVGVTVMSDLKGSILKVLFKAVKMSIWKLGYTCTLTKQGSGTGI